MAATPAKPELIEDLEWMARWGEVPEFAALRVGMGMETLRDKLRGAGRSDLWEKLQANRPDLNEETWRGHPIKCGDVNASARPKVAA